MDEFDELRADWNAMPIPWASPMQSHEWVRSWAEVYRIGEDLAILVSGRHPPSAIAPLVRSQFGGPWLELAGPHTLGEMMDFLYADRASVEALVDTLADLRLPLRFWRVPADSPLIPALQKAYRRRALIRCLPTAGCPSLPLGEGWIQPERQLDAHRRSNVRRAMRIAERMGPVSMEILAPEPESVGPLLREAYAVEEAGWKGRAGLPLARDAQVGEFMRRYAAAAAEHGSLRICFLRIGGRAAAMKIGVVTGNRFWLLAMGFSDEFARCSPGTLLLLETIRYAARSGLLSYEFLGADEPWIRALNAQVRPCVQIRIYPFGLVGTAALASDFRAATREGARALLVSFRRFRERIEERMGHIYVPGPEVEDAVRVCRSLAASGLASTISYSPAEADTPRAIARRYEATIDAINREGLDAYASVKATVLGFSRELFQRIAERAHERNVALHFDALSSDAADETFELIEELRSTQPAIGCTLPGRWLRSLRDAERAVDLGLSVRVIRGEWPDEGGQEIDSKSGFLALVDGLAGRARSIGVATHDPGLAREAIRRLRSAGTSCSLEVLWGYPIGRVLPVGVTERVPIRVYVPFGRTALPYSTSHVKRDARVVGWALRDILRNGESNAPTMSGGARPVADRRP